MAVYNREQPERAPGGLVTALCVEKGLANNMSMDVNNATDVAVSEQPMPTWC